MIPDPTHNPEPSGRISINQEGKFSADPAISCRVEEDEGAFLFNPDIDSTVLINSSGLMIWRFMNEPRTIGELVSFIMERSSECPDQSAVHADIIQFIAALLPDYIREV
jgi:hypothetical protein